MCIRLEPFVPYPSVTLLVSNSVFLTISSMICFVCDSIESMIVLVFSSVEEKPFLPISSCSWLMMFPFRDSISRFNPSISYIRIICGGMPVNSGVSFVLFQGWAVRTNNIISLGMSLKIGDVRKWHFLWSMAFNLLWWGKIVAKHHILKWFFLADMEVYLGIHVSNNWLVCLLWSSFSISHNSVKSKYGGETANSFFSWSKQLAQRPTYCSPAFYLNKYLSFTPHKPIPTKCIVQKYGVHCTSWSYHCRYPFAAGVGP